MLSRGMRCLVTAAGLLACGALQAMPPMLFPKAVPAVAPAEAPPAEPAQEPAQEAEQAQAPEQAQLPAPSPSLDLKLHEAPPTAFVAPVPDAPAPTPAAASDAAEPAAEAASAALEAPLPPKLVYERCGVVYEAARGSIATKVIPSMRVADLADDASFELPEDVPANVKAVQCGRDSVVPLPNDYKVLAAGFPLSILARDGRVAVLEAGPEGKLGLRTLEGKLSIDEDTRVKALIEEAQPAFDIAPRPGKR